MIGRLNRSSSAVITYILRNWPLRKQLGFYAFLPLFFASGALIEYLMINWEFNSVNFYKVYTKKYAQTVAKQAVDIEVSIDRLIESEREKLVKQLATAKQQQQINDKQEADGHSDKRNGQ
ncbi:small integral membrane protein 4-like [Oppia nitens]|uniref:small integral membrane protein 4-like n=1 Tax=Oppia nitens TaxID=1686743 RepID=UPI0023D9F824|nr:small integral membrane protein 4-like [Oppia nitens]